MEADYASLGRLNPKDKEFASSTIQANSCYRTHRMFYTAWHERYLFATKLQPACKSILLIATKAFKQITLIDLPASTVASWKAARLSTHQYASSHLGSKVDSVIRSALRWCLGTLCIKGLVNCYTVAILVLYRQQSTGIIHFKQLEGPTMDVLS
ncbi:hypothetical protein [Agarivorans litoreus]|uniref:hypothetical protein n=1 Tax=Agarivorans litoreus TaxID=1510455 RepID=UPI001C7CA6DC|nr:hypothetical protein [Agarivorans litoreus]